MVAAHQYHQDGGSTEVTSWEHITVTQVNPGARVCDLWHGRHVPHSSAAGHLVHVAQLMRQQTEQSVSTWC